MGIRCRDALALEILWRSVLVALGNSKRDATSSEAQLAHDVHRCFGLSHLIIAHDANVGRAIGHHLRNIIVAKVENLDGEVVHTVEELTLLVIHIQACILQ